MNEKMAKWVATAVDWDTTRADERQNEKVLRWFWLVVLVLAAFAAGHFM